MTLNERDIDLLTRIRDGRNLRPADRFEDRSRQKMRKLGFAQVIVNPRRWIITDAGRAVLQEPTDD